MREHFKLVLKIIFTDLEQAYDRVVQNLSGMLLVSLAQTGAYQKTNSCVSRWQHCQVILD